MFLSSTFGTIETARMTGGLTIRNQTNIAIQQMCKSAHEMMLVMMVNDVHGVSWLIMGDGS